MAFREVTRLGGTRSIKQFVRKALVRVIPDEMRRRLVARFPNLPLYPYGRGAASADFDSAVWEKFYAAEDPYNFATREYERQKYERTLEWIGDGPFERTFEIGCSVGVFTAMLAPRCQYLLAVDISENAIKQARARTREFPQVTCERRALPREMPAGPFDLIVCSDTLYYWRPETLREAMRAFEAMLAPGGRLVALHYTGGAEPDKVMDGHSVHDLLQAEFNLANTFSHEHEKYRLDRFEKPA